MIIDWLLKTFDWVKNIVAQYFAAITGLLGVFIGAWIAKRQIVKQRKLDFYEKQLRELYSPLVSIRKEIEILSEFRVVGEIALEEWWRKIYGVYEKMGDSQHAIKFIDEKGEKIESQIEYDNKQLKEKIIPSYRKMIDVFKGNFWLAEFRTKEYFPLLVKFVETWERFLSRTHEADVLEKIQIKEDELKSFYRHIEEIHSSLREKLKNAKT